MRRGQAIAMVASHVAGLLLAGTAEEATGLIDADLDRLSEADRDRVEKAVQEVARRLYRMGEQHVHDGDHGDDGRPAADGGHQPHAPGPLGV